MNCNIKINRINKSISVECNISYIFDEFAKQYATIRNKMKTNLYFYGFNIDMENTVIDYAYIAFDDNIIIEEKTFNMNTDLFDVIDENDKKAIYRLLALKYHPDKGGNNEMMSFINNKFKK